MMPLLKQYIGFRQSTFLFEPHTLLDMDHFLLAPYDPVVDQAIIPDVQIAPNEVLGKRVEHFFEYYLKCPNQYSLLAKNIQVFRHKTTIGELDFLICTTETNEVIHVELSYKFYLYVPKVSDTDVACWIGPNQKDSLVQKVDKLKNKQFPLLHSVEAKTILHDFGITSDQIEQRSCMLGQLFIPFDSFNSNDHSFTPTINSKCIRGFWIPAAVFLSGIYKEERFYIPQKKDWVVMPNDGATWYSFEEISKEIVPHHTAQKSPLLWMKSKGHVFTSFFVVWW